MKSSTISARMDSKLKHNAEQIFRQLGLTASQAITLFYRQVEMQRGLPFSQHIPNETTRRALDDARNHHDLVDFDNMDDLFEDTNID